ncbi:MAG TPA: putative peptidoglycan glycosyltransferase FtsW [Candidatus Saccharimonadales bacterium]|jgi:cell division protein FtsW
MDRVMPRKPKYLSKAGDVELGRRHKPDYWLVIICAVLLLIGVVVVYAIGPALQVTTHLSASYYTSRQLLAIALCVIAFLITASIPIAAWKRFYKPVAILALGATLLAIVLPVNPSYPAHRWVRLGGLSFQSVELVKFAVIIWLAFFLVRAIKNNTITDFKKTLWPILVALVVIGVLIAGVQSDLGSMGVIVAIMATMSFVAGLPLKKIAIIGCIIVAGLILAISIFPYRRARLETYLHPSSNCQTASGYQACQALIAVGSGGIFGLGLGHSVQAYGYEPEADNDSIFAIYAETFGFFGCVILLALFAGLFSRLKNIAEKIDDDFSRLIVVGVLTWLSVQTIINVGAMVGLLPLKGITLPFISYGGTSIVFAAAAIGVVFQISRYTSYKSPGTNTYDDSNNRRQLDEDRLNRRRVRGAYHPTPGGSIRTKEA